MGRLGNIEQGIAQISGILGTLPEELGAIKQRLERVENKLETPSASGSEAEIEEVIGAAPSRHKSFGYAYLYFLNQTELSIQRLKEQLQEMAEASDRVLHLNQVEKELEPIRTAFRSLLEEDDSLANNTELKRELQIVANPVENTSLETIEHHLLTIQQLHSQIAHYFDLPQ